MRKNGSVIGPRVSTASAASGMWTVDDVFIRTAANAWPTLSIYYSLFPNKASYIEGEAIVFTVYISYVNVPSIVLYWSNIGTTSGNDFTDGLNSGTVVVADGIGTFTLTLKNDILLEGTENVIIRLRTESNVGTIVATSQVIPISDTSYPLYSGLTLTYDFANDHSAVSFYGTVITGLRGGDSVTTTAGVGGLWSITNNNGYAGGVRGGNGGPGFGGNAGGGRGSGIGAYDAANGHNDISGLNDAVTGCGLTAASFGNGSVGGNWMSASNAANFAGGGRGGAGAGGGGNYPSGAAGVIIKYTAFGTTYYYYRNQAIHPVAGSITFPEGTSYVKVWAIGRGGTSGMSGTYTQYSAGGAGAGGCAYCEFIS